MNGPNSRSGGHAFKRKAELEKTATEFSGALSQLGTELKHAYVRLRKAL